MVALACNFCTQPIPTCGTKATLPDIMSHVMQCGFSTCLKSGLPCYCTCAHCQGRQVHPTRTVFAQYNHRRRNSDTEEEESTDLGEVTTIHEGDGGSSIKLELIIDLIIMAKFLPPYTLLSLAATNKSIFGLLHSQIAKNFVFNSNRSRAISLYGLMENIKCEAPRLPDPLPFAVTHVTIETEDDVAPINFEDKVPDQVTSLNSDTRLSSLPAHLEEFRTRVAGLRDANGLIKLPHTLTSLSINNLSESTFQLPVLPPSLTSLKFEGFFYYLTDPLPKGLLKLDRVSLLQEIKLPPKLKELCVRLDRPGIMLNFPSSLQDLIIYGHYSDLSLPQNLVSLTLTQPIPYSSLPKGLKELKMMSSNTQPVSALPPNLMRLTIKQFDQPLDNLPASLTSLRIGNNFDRSVDNLPSSLLKLNLGNSFNQPINKLPPTLKRLKLGHAFNHPVDLLPPTLEYLSLGDKFNYPVDNLPRKLRDLRLGHEFNQPLDKLPAGLNLIIDSFASFWNLVPPPCVASVSYHGSVFRRAPNSSICFWVNDRALAYYDKSRTVHVAYHKRQTRMLQYA